MAKVHTDSHVAFERRLYSVPWRYVGTEVWIRATPTSLLVYHADERIATHSRRGPGLRSTIDGHLPEYRAVLRHRSRGYWEQRASQMGPAVAEYIGEVFDSDDVLTKLRTVQAMVTHLEKFPIARARAACRRAQHYASYTYQGLKNILRRALDLQPLPDDQPVQPSALPTPRYARRLTDILNLVEATHDCN